MSDFRQKVIDRNGTLHISLPIEFCRRWNVEAGDHIDVLIHQLIKKDKRVNIVKARYESV